LKIENFNNKNDEYIMPELRKLGKVNTYSYYLSYFELFDKDNQLAKITTKTEQLTAISLYKTLM
jgi:hypothetical protein